MTDVRTQSAEAAKLNEDCALIAALLGGTKTMRVAGKKYLPQWPGEDSESYDLRLAVATLFPAYARTIDVLSAKPFSKPVTLGEDVPERLKPWLQNVDLSGRDLHSFLSEITQEAMGYLRFDAAVQVAPPAGAWWRKGVAYEQLGDKAKARASYMQSLALDPAFDKAKQALAKLDTPKT